jgi:Protein of unknown function (DUF3039)
MSTPEDSPQVDRRLGTLVEERAETQLDDGEHDRFSHYVQKDKILESAVTGTPVIALCGKVWVPSRDPQRYRVCPTCKEIYEQFPAGDEGGDGGDGGEG